jgi:GNAT superfamily N-acetyltransferase
MSGGKTEVARGEQRGELAVHRFDAARRADFDRVHCEANDAGWCRCVAWWVETWDGWGERSAEANRALRDELCARGEYDGYLLYERGEPAGWCQAGPRDRLAKLVRQFGLAPDPRTWAVTCFLIDPARRRRGLARHFLSSVLSSVKARGARRVEAFPKRGTELDALDLWNGPEALYRAEGFRVVRDDPVRPVLALEW